MAEKKPGDKTLTVPTKTLTLTPRVEKGTVRQSFSHGRTKQVVVEKRGPRPKLETEKDEKEESKSGESLGDLLGKAPRQQKEDHRPPSETPAIRFRPILPIEAIPDQNLKRAIAF